MEKSKIVHEPSIKLTLPDYEGADRSEIIIAAFERFDPAISDRWTKDGRKTLCDSLEETLLKVDPTTADFDIADIIAAAKEQDMHIDLNQQVVSELEDDYIEEEYNDRDLAREWIADDFNDYDFRRKMCDIFELGYQASTIDLLRLLTAKIDKEWLMIF